MLQKYHYLQFSCFTLALGQSLIMFILARYLCLKCNRMRSLLAGRQSRVRKFDFHLFYNIKDVAKVLR